jgi:hypothetical protein
LESLQRYKHSLRLWVNKGHAISILSSFHLQVEHGAFQSETKTKIKAYLLDIVLSFFLGFESLINVLSLVYSRLRSVHQVPPVSQLTLIARLITLLGIYYLLNDTCRSFLLEVLILE